MKKLFVFAACLFILAMVTPGLCGGLSSLAVGSSTAAANLKQKDIEQTQVEENLFKNVNPDLAYSLREMRLSNEHSNDTIDSVVKSGHRAMVAISYNTTFVLVLVFLIIVGVGWIFFRVGKLAGGDK
jgi:hypothetical protein